MTAPRYAGTSTVGRRGDVSKGVLRQGVAPKLARRAPLVGTGARRVVTGDLVNARRVIGKGVGAGRFKDAVAAVPKAPGRAVRGTRTWARGTDELPPMRGAGKAKDTLARLRGREVEKADVEKFGGSVLSALRGGVAAGRAGVKPSAILPSSRISALTPMGTKALGVGQKAGAGYTSGLTALKTNPGKIGLGTGAAGGMVLGGTMARNNSVQKRRYDPEDERRHRQGLEAGLMGSAGVGALGYSGRQVYRDTTNLRRSIRELPTLKVSDSPPKAFTPRRTNTRGNPRKATPDELKADQVAHAHEVNTWHGQHKAKTQIERARKTPVKGVVIRGRAGLAGLAGLGLSGAAASHHMRRNESRWD